PAQDYLEGVASRVHCGVIPWRMPHVVIDDNLVTAWGPWSADCFSMAVMALIAEQRKRRHPASMQHA
ncbi:MAG TPA: hypothetical protein VKY31_10615, partial [Terriglobia bacterium]|nr:hypothetical protein [Terriglobia bacterium]